MATFTDEDYLRMRGAPQASSTLSTSLNVAEGYDPDREARKVNVARELGISPLLVGDVDKAEKEAARKKQYTVEDIARDAPGLAKALENPVVARMAQGAINDLTMIGRDLARIGRY